MNDELMICVLLNQIAMIQHILRPSDQTLLDLAKQCLHTAHMVEIYRAAERGIDPTASSPAPGE